MRMVMPFVIIFDLMQMFNAELSMRRTKVGDLLGMCASGWHEIDRLRVRIPAGAAFFMGAES